MNISGTNNRHGKTIKLRAPTLARIDRLRHKGQSYDGVITELLDFHDSYGIESTQNQPSRKGRMRETDNA